jgi:hypothetical protein
VGWRGVRWAGCVSWVEENGWVDVLVT